MSDLIEALKTRLSSPLFGYFALALLAFNWKAFFFLFVQGGDVLGRIQFFEEHTTVYSLGIWPLSFSFAFALFYPWVIFLVAWMTSRPIEMKDMVQARSEHTVLLRRKQLEDARSNLLASAELELIERAKRDQKLDEFQNEELKEKLKAELEQLRVERDSLREKNQSPHARHNELMDIAGTYRKRAAESKDYDDRARFFDRARVLEEQAHQLLTNSEIMSGGNA